MQGLHLTADLYHCQSDRSLMIDETILAEFCRNATLRAGLTIVGEKWHTFPEYQGEPGGVTGTLLLAESHLAIHTWPERGGVTLDVYVCNFEADNSARAERLMDELEMAFQPSKSQRQRIMRGDRDGPVEAAPLYMETLNEDSVYGFRFQRKLLDRNTGLQHLELLESDELGRAFRLDGCLMTSEADEAFYHESLIHPAAIAHPHPRNALIIGGGDGGALEELLKHQTIESATLVDLDAEVIDIARRYFQSINRGSLDDPRANILIQDGAAFVRDTRDTYDLVYLDLTDPETPAGPLYTRVFFEACRRIMRPGAALVLHVGSLFHEAEQVDRLMNKLRQVFAEVQGYGLHIPLYGSFWGLAIASDTLKPAGLSADQIEERLDQREIADLDVYSPAFHGSLFALPVRYQRLLEEKVAA